MNRLALGILISITVMFVTLYLCDIADIIVTPLTQYGATHWIPEALAIFLCGRWFSKKKPSLVYLGFALCIMFLWAPLYYTLRFGSALLSFGIGTSSFFVAVLIMGLWSASKK